MQTTEVVEQLFQAQSARIVAATDGAGNPRFVRARAGESDAGLYLGAEVMGAALAQFAARQSFGAVKQAVVLCQGATVVLNATRDGGLIVVVADANANLGLLLMTCRTALAEHGVEGGRDVAGA